MVPLVIGYCGCQGCSSLSALCAAVPVRYLFTLGGAGRLCGSGTHTAPQQTEETAAGWRFLRFSSAVCVGTEAEESCLWSSTLLFI